MKYTVCIEARPFAVISPVQMNRLLENPELEVLDCRGKTVDDPDFMEKLKRADIIISGNDLQVTENLLQQLPHLKLIAKVGVGLDMINMDAATAKGVLICNTPGANNTAVAEHTFALLLSHMRQVFRCDSGMREGKWEQGKFMGSELSEKNIGIVGLGSIGRCVAAIAKGFGMKLYGYDPFWPEAFAQEYGIKKMNLNDLLAIADVVSIHCPLMKETENLIDSNELNLMKPSALLVNMARGGIVNEKALYDALISKKIAGAILDAYNQEPPVDLPFASLSNVTLSPHAGAFTTDALEKMSKGVTDQVLDFIQGKLPQYLKNPKAVQNS